MPYLPPDVLNDTILPSAYSPYKDLKVVADLLKEEWKLFYPTISYQMIDLDIKKAENDVSGDLPHTTIDDLWGEDVPQSNTLDKKWYQPHAQTPEGDELDAAEGKKYKEAVAVQSKIERASVTHELGNFGINDERDISFAIPTPLLDEVGIVVRIGDIFKWDGEIYEVVEWNKEYYWKNTNVFLSIVGYAKRREIGS